MIIRRFPRGHIQIELLAADRARTGEFKCKRPWNPSIGDVGGWYSIYVDVLNGQVGEAWVGRRAKGYPMELVDARPGQLLWLKTLAVQTWARRKRLYAGQRVRCLYIAPEQFLTWVDDDNDNIPDTDDAA